MAISPELFSVKCLFRHEPSGSDACKHLYEERITIWRTKTAVEAIRLAEQEAEKYVAASEKPVQYIGYCVSYATYQTRFRNGMGVFSLIRESDLPAEKYLDRFYDTGKERVQSFRVRTAGD